MDARGRGDRTVLLLLGPKGSGKSFLGDLLASRLGVRFVRVEPWAMEVRGGRPPDDPAYARDAFERIGDGILEALGSTDLLAFESTGSAAPFDAMLARLEARARVVPIGVRADLDVCLRRIRARDPAAHVDVPEDVVRRIHLRAAERAAGCAFVIDNTDATPEELVAALGAILAQVTGSAR